MPPTHLTNRFRDALEYALNLHQGQMRKKTEIPYFSHLMAVAAIVLEDGGSEDEAIAALLHDGPEDRGGRGTLNDIRVRFGETVARIVEGCSDSLVDTRIEEKAPWGERKLRYLEHLKGSPDDVVRVSLADKLHNIRSIIMDLRVENPVSRASVWERFNGGREGSLWYYQELAKIFCARRGSDPRATEFQDLATRLETLAE